MVPQILTWLRFMEAGQTSSASGAPALASVSAAPCSGAASDKISVDKIFPPFKTNSTFFFFFIKSLEATTLMILSSG